MFDQYCNKSMLLHNQHNNVYLLGCTLWFVRRFSNFSNGERGEGAVSVEVGGGVVKSWKCWRKSDIYIIFVKLIEHNYQ